jgi:hypothetical protein
VGFDSDEQIQHKPVTANCNPIVLLFAILLDNYETTLAKRCPANETLTLGGSEWVGSKLFYQG